MAQRPGNGLSRAYTVFAIIVALMMFVSASGKLTGNAGATHTIHDVVGVPLRWFPLLAALEIAGGLGLLAGIFRPRLGVAAAGGLVLYFIGAFVGHIRVGDWAGLKAPVVPLLLSVVVLALRVASMRKAAATSG